MRETESNLISGGVIQPQNRSKSGASILKTVSGSIYVRDEQSENIVMQSFGNQKKVTIEDESSRNAVKNTLKSITKEAEVQTQHNLPKVLKINNQFSSNSNSNHEIKVEECEPVYYHQYDNLDLNGNGGGAGVNPKKKPESWFIPAGKSNEAFEDDNGNLVAFGKKQYQPQLSGSPKSLPTQTLCVKRFNRLNNSSNKYGAYTRINNSFGNGRIDKNASLRSQPRLNRKQIEKEFYEYTLECRRRLNELFADSLSSDSTPRSSVDIPIISHHHHLNLSAQNLTGGKKPVSYSNNFNMIKKARQSGNFGNNNGSTSNMYAYFTNGNSSSNPTPTIRRKKIETEQIWHI